MDHSLVRVGDGKFQFRSANQVSERVRQRPAGIDFDWHGFDQGNEVTGEGWTAGKLLSVSYD